MAISKVLTVLKNKMEEYVKTSHTAIFSGPTNCGKTKLVLDLLEKEYQGHYENIVIICPTLRRNRTYLDRSWIWKNNCIFCVEPKDRLFDWVKQLSQIFDGEETLFIVDDIIADETLDKKRQPLVELAISGRHKKHSLWLLTQSYTAIPKNLRRQKKQLFFWYPNEKSDLKIADEETNVIPHEQLENINENLKCKNHACLYVRTEHPRNFKIINGGNDNKS